MGDKDAAPQTDDGNARVIEFGFAVKGPDETRYLGLNRGLVGPRRSLRREDEQEHRKERNERWIRVGVGNKGSM
jgi:hypothetical protein